MSFFENWKAFRIRADKENLTPACKVVFYELLGQFNDAFWAEEITLKDSELMRLTQIRSRQTIADAKSRLKLLGLIDFKASKYYGTTYKLVPLVSSSWSEQTGQQTGQQAGQPERDSYTHVREDVKTGRQEDKAGATADAGATLSAEIVNLWRGDIGELGGWVYQKLLELQQRFGVEKLKYAITEGIEIHGATLGVRYVQRVLENPQERPQKKGARKVDSDDRFDYRSRYDEL